LQKVREFKVFNVIWQIAKVFAVDVVKA